MARAQTAGTRESKRLIKRNSGNLSQSFTRRSFMAKPASQVNHPTWDHQKPPWWGSEGLPRGLNAGDGAGGAPPTTADHAARHWRPARQTQIARAGWF